MLEPYTRSLLLDLLRPPDEYRLDVGVGTTYTLDLVSLLTAPFAFASYAQPEEGPQAGSLEVLNGLHEYANRLTIFCHEGKIGIPCVRYPQLAYLERTVVACRSPRGGAFHPKVWLLRFERNAEDVVYRFLCLSRNLTFDRSWDTALTLEGPLLNRKNAVAANHPLGNFVAALPDMAVSDPGDEVRARVARLQDEVRRVDFAVPDGFQEYRFWPIGHELGRSQWPFGETGTRMLVVSPFLSRNRLERFAEGRSDNLLVSTLSALNEIGGTPLGYERTYVLNDNAKPEPDAADGEQGVDGEPEIVPSDLHAKLYVANAGGSAHIWTGSANATDAAFEKNVEFLVELVGPKRAVGIDNLMVSEKGTTRLVDILQETTHFEVLPVDDVEKRLEALLDSARDALLHAGLSAAVCPAEAEGRFDVTLRTSQQPADLAADVVFAAWPITLPQNAHAKTLAINEPTCAVFNDLSFEALTTFFAFEIEARASNRVRREAFVLNVLTQGLPEDRRERLLRLMISDRNRFVQFLLLLLGEGDESAYFSKPGGTQRGSTEQPAAFLFAGQPLLECLVRALERHPERLDQVARLVTELAASGNADQVLPPDFSEIWAPIATVRQGMLHGSSSAS